LFTYFHKEFTDISPAR